MRLMAYESVRVSRWSDDHAHKSSLEAAAEAAAKVNAMLIAKGKLKPSQLSQQQGLKPKSTSQPGSLIVAEVEINDVPIGCRNMLTRGATQEEISKLSGSAVSTRGRYLSPEEKMRNLGDRPLYLCVQGSTQESVDIAVGRINEIILNGMKSKGSRFTPITRPVAPIQRPMLSQPPPLMSLETQPPPIPSGVPVLQEKLYIGLEHAPPNFDVKNKMLGPMGSFLNHIQTETGAKVTLRGKGSGFLEPLSGREAFEPMHVHIQHGLLVGLQNAKQLAENLIQTVQQDYAQFQQALVAMPPTLSPATATILAGLQQSTPGGIFSHPTLGALSGVTQALSLQPQPGLQPLNSMPAINQPVMTNVVLSSSPVLTSNNPVGSSIAGPHPQQVIVQTQVPPPHAVPHLGPQHLYPGNPPPASSPQPLMTTVQPELVPASLPMWGSPAPAGMPAQQIIQQIPMSVGAPVSSYGPPISSAYPSFSTSLGPSTSTYAPISSVPLARVSSPVAVTSSTTSGYSYNGPLKEENKRRFTEEKPEEKVPENLLGYEHGPPHLTNLVVQGPPPVQSQSPSQGQLVQAPVTHVIQTVTPTQVIHGPPPAQIVQGPPPGYQAPPPHFIHGPPPPGQIPAPYQLGAPPTVSEGVPVMSQSTQPPLGSPVYSVHTSISEEGRVTHTYTVQSNTGGLASPPQESVNETDKKLMPPPALPTGVKRSASDSLTESPERKSRKDSDDEDEEVKSSMRQQHKEAKKYQYNQYSSTPQLYGQPPPPEQLTTSVQYRGDTSPGHQFEQAQQPPPQFLPPGQVVSLPQPTETSPGSESLGQPGLQQQIIIQQPPQLPGHPQSPAFQQPMYSASGSHSPTPPPPWNPEPPPVSGPSPGPAQPMLPQQITLSAPHRVNPQEQRLMTEEHRIYGEAIPPPPPNFQAGPPPPGSTPQLIVPPHLPPPTQTIVSIPQFNGQPPPFPGQPPPQGGYQYPTGPPLTMSYW
ncbi:KH homology domain-containing protein 4-like isoform X1 [Saccostrea echinata]|uniref:KH homology domain-containing protein 4-like isoform X1 n=1 Tax=Saccostrea echinata TaxID=191078 RepID=UPI002A805990|nr:KH homology domain-containing protein 4-like isoform X1 [Saccostrea echinata]